MFVSTACTTEDKAEMTLNKCRCQMIQVVSPGQLDSESPKTEFFEMTGVTRRRETRKLRGVAARHFQGPELE
jgi:hypothetical protein